MKKAMFLLVFLSSLMSSTTFAQNSTSVTNNGGVEIGGLLRSNTSSGQFITVMDTGLQGSPYLSDEWQKGVAESNDNEKFDVYARYRYYDNAVEIKKNSSEEIFILGKSFTKSVTIGDKQFVVLEHTTAAGITKKDFFEMLAEGDLRLLVQYDKMIVDGVNNGYSHTPRELKSKQKYLVYDQKQKKMIPLSKLNKKAISPLFGKHSAKVAAHAKKNKLSFKRISGLTKIFEYYNSNCKTK